jgi:hypothetical protein
MLKNSSNFRTTLHHVLQREKWNNTLHHKTYVVSASGIYFSSQFKW